MPVSRLERSTKSRLRDAAALRAYCDENKIPYSHDPVEKILPTPALAHEFDQAYAMAPLPPTTLTNQGASTILVCETKYVGSDHGLVVSAIAERVGHNLEPGVDAFYIWRSPYVAFREAREKSEVDSIKQLFEDQGVPVIQNSNGWDDSLLSLGPKFDEEVAHSWRCTSFMVDSTGNEGRYGFDGDMAFPRQKHNTLSHETPLAVHIGAAAQQPDGTWQVEGYSSANGPCMVAPVAATRAMAKWNEAHEPEIITGTSFSAPFVSGVLAALNRRYGPYVTREQILYAVLATCEPVSRVGASDPCTPKAHALGYHANAAGLLYNEDYAGFGLINPYKADHVLGHLVAMTQQDPSRITVPTEKRVLVNIPAGDSPEKTADGHYRYRVHMPPGMALKTTLEAEFEGARGQITLRSPSGTLLPMALSESPNKKLQQLGLSTSHGWCGESLEGEWTIISTTPLSRLRLNQHHFQSKDIIQDLDIPALLAAPVPDLSTAKPLTQLARHHSIRRIMDSEELGGEPVVKQIPPSSSVQPSAAVREIAHQAARAAPPPNASLRGKSA